MRALSKEKGRRTVADQRPTHEEARSSSEAQIRDGQQVQAYLRTQREKGGIVNTAIVMASARGIMLKPDCTSLAEFGGHVSLTKEWARSLLL